MVPQQSDLLPWIRTSSRVRRSSGTLAVLDTVIIAQHIEFANGVDADQVLAGTTGLQIILQSVSRLTAS